MVMEVVVNRHGIIRAQDGGVDTSLTRHGDAPRLVLRALQDIKILPHGPVVPLINAGLSYTHFLVGTVMFSQEVDTFLTRKPAYTNLIASPSPDNLQQISLLGPKTRQTCSFSVSEVLPQATRLALMRAYHFSAASHQAASLPWFWLLLMANLKTPARMVLAVSCQCGILDNST